MKNSFVVKSLSNRIALLAFAMTLSIGVAGNAHATSCQNLLQGHKNWLSETIPSDYNRSLYVTMVSNSASAKSSNPDPQATYLHAKITNSSGFLGFFGGSGEAMFNDREWEEKVDCDELPDGGLCIPPQHPFDPYNTDTWTILFATDGSSMTLAKSGNNLSMPLDCDGNLMVATHTKKKVIRSSIFGNNYEIAIGKIKYLLSFSRNEVDVPK